MNARLVLSMLCLAPHAVLAGDSCPDPDSDMPGYIFCEGQKRLERERGREERDEPGAVEEVLDAANLAVGALVRGEAGKKGIRVAFAPALGRGRALVVLGGAGVLSDAHDAASGEVLGVRFRFDTGLEGLDGSANGRPLFLDFKDGRVTGRVMDRAVDLVVAGRSLKGTIGSETITLEVDGLDLESCCGAEGALTRKVVAVAVIAAAGA